MVEGRGRPAGITLESAKGQTQRWQPLLPNLQRVNAAASATGRTRFTALLHHVDVAALERAFGRQRRAASLGVDRVRWTSMSKIWRETSSDCTHASTAGSTGGRCIVAGRSDC